MNKIEQQSIKDAFKKCKDRFEKYCEEHCNQKSSCRNIGLITQAKDRCYDAYLEISEYLKVELLKEAEGIIVQFMDVAKNESIVRKNGLSYKAYIMELLALKSELKALDFK